MATRLHGDDGTAIAELALLLPFLATFVFGVVDLGRAWQLKNRLTSAAREGAMVARDTPGFVSCPTGRSIIGAVRAEDPGLAGDPTLQVAVRNVTRGTTYSAPMCVPHTGLSGDQVRVTVSVQFAVLTPAVATLTGSSISVSGFAQMVVQ